MPTGQIWHTAGPSLGLYVFGGHGRQSDHTESVDDVKDETFAVCIKEGYHPAAHRQSEREVEPPCRVVLPSGQRKQARESIEEEYMPIGHTAHTRSTMVPLLSFRNCAKVPGSHKQSAIVVTFPSPRLLSAIVLPRGQLVHAHPEP